MKKNVKMMVALMVAFITILVSQECTLAATTRHWAISKTPGSIDVDTTVEIPYCTGDITYTLSTLSGDYTHIVADFRTPENQEHLYYINTYEKSIRFTSPDSKVFRMAYTNEGLSNYSNITFICTIEHGLSDDEVRYKTLVSAGTITYTN